MTENKQTVETELQAEIKKPLNSEDPILEMKGQLKEVLERLDFLEERMEEVEEGQVYSQPEPAATVLGEQYLLSPEAFNIAYFSLYEGSLYQMQRFPPQTEQDHAYYQQKVLYLIRFISDVLAIEENSPLIALIAEVFERWMAHHGKDISTPPPLTAEWFGEELLQNVSFGYEDDDVDYEEEDDEA